MNLRVENAMRIIRKLFKILGIVILCFFIMISFFMLWLGSLGSTDDCDIERYTADVSVMPAERMIEVRLDMTLKARNRMARVNFMHGLGVEVDVKDVVDLMDNSRLSYKTRRLTLPIVGEWPKLNILTADLKKDIHRSGRARLGLHYTVSPNEKEGRFFRGIAMSENEVDVPGKSASFPCLMFSLRDFFGMIRGNMGVFRFFPYELKIDIPEDWKAMLYYGMGTLENVEEQEKRSIFHLSSRGGVALPIPAFQARRVFDMTIRENRIRDFKFMWQKVDAVYPFFIVKDVDWNSIYGEFKPRIEAAGSDIEHYKILSTMLRRLHDGHAYIGTYEGKPAQTRLDFAIREVEGCAVIDDVNESSEPARLGLRRGMTVESVDGIAVYEKIEEMIPRMRASTPREARARAYDRLTLGEPGQSMTLAAVNREGKRFKASLTFPDLTDDDQRVYERISFRFLHDDLGYIRIPFWHVKAFSVDEFDAALERLKNTRGMILDLRGNWGGSGFNALKAAGRFLRKKTHFGSVAYRKSAADHSAFSKPVVMRVSPGGPWQYKNPVVFLVDHLVASSSERFVMGLKDCGRAVVIGSQTAGSLSNSAPIWLPSGIRIYLSNQIDYSPEGEIVEGNGIVPDILVEQTLFDFYEGRDTVLLKAIEYLLEKG